MSSCISHRVHLIASPASTNLPHAHAHTQPEKRTQFRISGLLKIDSDSESDERAKYWRELDPAQREWWAYPAPGSVRGISDMADSEVLRGEDVPPRHFCICTLVPDFVEVFDQKLKPMRRVQYVMGHNDNWVSVLVHA